MALSIAEEIIQGGKRIPYIIVFAKYIGEDFKEVGYNRAEKSLL